MMIETRNLLARDVMNRNVQALKPDTGAREAVSWLVDHGYSGAPVVDDAGRVLGVFTEHDSMRALSDSLVAHAPVGKVEGYMTKELTTVAPDAPLTELERLFVRGKHRRLLVVDGGVLVGIVTRRDLVRGLSSMLEPTKQFPSYRVLERMWR